ncbi:MAG: 30S ribosomal protein S16 [bacterium]|nr:30S ribosomal protein S16 [bacterium]
MTLKIRLSNIGKKGKSIYRIVVAPERSKRGGQYTDILGFYNKELNPPLIKVDKEKYQKWIKFGAQETKIIRKIIER